MSLAPIEFNDDMMIIIVIIIVMNDMMNDKVPTYMRNNSKFPTKGESAVLTAESPVVWESGSRV